MKPSSRKIARRTKRRGAAMVEAAVVLPILVMFFGLQLFIYNVFTSRQEVMVASRNDAFNKALRGGCSGFLPYPSKVQTPHDAAGSQIAEAAQLNSMTSSGLAVVDGKADKKVANSKLSNDVLPTPTVRHHSFVYCNTASGLAWLGDGLSGFITIGFRAIANMLP